MTCYDMKFAKLLPLKIIVISLYAMILASTLHFTKHKHKSTSKKIATHNIQNTA